METVTDYHTAISGTENPQTSQMTQAEPAEPANECADCRLFIDGLCTHEDAQGNNARAFAFWAQAVKGYCPKWEAKFKRLPLREKAMAIEGAKSLADLVP